MTSASPPLSERSLARTYDGGSYADPWTAVEDYRRVRRMAVASPDLGSSALATRLELPRSRIRPWLEGSAPDSVRAIERATEYGWLSAAYDDSTWTALNALVAHCFAGGSIAADNYLPTFTCSNPYSSLTDALTLAGLEYERVHEESDERSTELRPTPDGPLLGRLLATLGAPVGSKTDGELSLPAYLQEAPSETRELFVYSYLENRVTRHPEKATLSIFEDRSQQYLIELADLIESIAGQPVTVTENTITIPARGARALQNR